MGKLYFRMKVNKLYNIESNMQMNLASRMCKGILPKPIFWPCFTNQYSNILLLHEARFVVGLRRPLHMCEARFICILDLMLYHLLPIGNNFSIDKLNITPNRLTNKTLFSFNIQSQNSTHIYLITIVHYARFRLVGLGPNNCEKGKVAKFMDGVETDSTWKCDAFNWNMISGPAGKVWRYYGYNDSYWLPAEVFPPGYVEEFVIGEVVIPICTSTTEVDMPCPANYIWSQGSTGPFFCRKVIY